MFGVKAVKITSARETPFASRSEEELKAERRQRLSLKGRGLPAQNHCLEGGVKVTRVRGLSVSPVFTGTVTAAALECLPFQNRRVTELRRGGRDKRQARFLIFKYTKEEGDRQHRSGSFRSYVLLYLNKYWKR